MRFEAPDDLREDVDTFRLLFLDELRDEGVTLDSGVEDLPPCGGLECAGAAFESSAAERIVVGTVSRFGQKLLVNAQLVAPDGRTDSRRIVIDRIEDLDVAAKRLADALRDQVSVERNAKLGEITALETQRDRRRRGTGGLSFGLGGVIPLDDTYAGNDGGLGFQLGYWYETKHFAIEPSLGFRFSTDARGDRRFFDVPLLIGGYWIMGLGDFAPFIGGGGGIRYIYEARPGTVRVGDVIFTEHQGETADDLFAGSLFAKLGVLILRTYSVRATISFAYEVSFVDLNDTGFPQNIFGMVAVHF